MNSPPLNPIPIFPSLNTTPTHTPRIQTPTHTSQTTPIALQTQQSLTIPFSDTEFPLDPFDITLTHSPPPSPNHIPDPSDIDQLLLRSINKPHTRKTHLFPTSFKGRRKHSQFDPSFLLPKPCLHSQPGHSFHPPKLLKIPVLESFETLSEKYPLGDVYSTTFSLLYPRILSSNSGSKHTTSSLDNLSDSKSEFTLRKQPRHRYNLRNNHIFSPSSSTSLASPTSS